MPSPRETVLCQYHYDPLDRLTSHALPDIPKRQRFYCKSRLATEIQGEMRYSIVQHAGQLLAQQRSEGEAPDTTLLATDQQRSVLQTLKANHPRQPIAYSPYGHRPVENGLLSLLGFNGERPDPVTGHYLLGNGYRAFNPVLMRFNSPDSLSPFDKGGLNSYAYCLHDPINFSDTSGHAGSFISLVKSLFTPASDPLSRLHNTRFGNRPFPIRQRRLSDPGPTISSPVEPDFLGYHGTSIEGATELLKKGVLPNHSKVADRPGFFLTPDKSVADEYAESAHWKSTRTEQTRFGKEHIVEVHIQNSKGMTPGKDYEFNHYAFDQRNLNHMTMEFIAKPHIFRSVIIRQLGSTPSAKKVRPRAFEAPF
ncbi:MAG TPA: RHS repeat-associated core domain-containing protein [Pseudomonas sp.]|jgi:RHS repeat-associated protein|nr:RHS repeat-associated core domain-containing protein [Pseudomonas sp.]